MLMNRSSAFIARAGDPPSAFAASLKRYDGRCGDQSGRTFPSSDLVRGRCQSYEASEVWLIPLASTCPVAWRYLMRHVSLHPSSFALPLWLRPRSSGHRHMPRQNRLRPVLRTRRKISRRAMAEEDGASFNLAWPARVFGALIGTGRDRLAARWTDDCRSRAAAARPSASCDSRSAGKRVRPRRYFSADGRPKLTLREW